MATQFDEASCASVPAQAIAALAALRTREGIRVLVVNDRLWVWWSPGDDEVVRRVLPLPGVELFARRDGRWYRCGRRLPCSGVPEEREARPLSSVLTPAPVAPQMTEVTLDPVRLKLVRGGPPRPATAIRCRLADLAGWADQATSRQFEGLEATYCGELVLLKGERLPPIANGDRWWGGDVLIPLGFRPEPNLKSEVLRRLLGLSSGEVALLTGEGAEVVAAGAFGKLTRAGVRLAGRGMR